MAKKTNATHGEDNGSATTVSVNVPAPGTDNLTMTYDRWTVTAQDLGWPAGVAIDKRLAYLIENGFTQSMTDAAAMTKDQKAVWEGKGKDRVKVRDKTEDEVKAESDTKRQARFDAIRSGTVASRTIGPRLPPLERVMREVAVEQVKAAIAALNAKARAAGTPEREVPKGDALATYVDKWLAKYGDAVRTEAQARIDAAAKVAESAADESDIFG